MTEYKPNSHKSKEENKEERKKLEPIAKAKKVDKKDQSFKDLIKSNMPSIKEYVIYDILVPTAKKAVSEIIGSSSDIIVDTVDTLLFGEKRGRRKRGGSKTSYYKYYEDRDRDRDRDRRRGYERARRGYDFDDILLDSRREAEEVLDRMEDLIDTYKIVSVADLYDLVGISGNYTDNKYGWTNLRNAYVESHRDGYSLKLPKPLPLD